MQVAVEIDVVARGHRAQRRIPGDCRHARPGLLLEDLDLGEAQEGARHRDADVLTGARDIFEGEARLAQGVKAAFFEDDGVIRVENGDGEVHQPLRAAIESVPENDRADIVGVEQVDLPP